MAELDIQPIMERAQNYHAKEDSLFALHGAAQDVPALITEVMRLRAENKRLKWAATPGGARLAMWLAYLWRRLLRKP